MINTHGEYLLVLIYSSPTQRSVTTQILESFAACKAVLEQLSAARDLMGYCVAATLQ